jgi:hypothetical protein
VNTSICPKCKTKLVRNPELVNNLIRFIGVCTCGYSREVTLEILNEHKAKVFSGDKIKQFLLTLPKQGLNQSEFRKYEELKEIMETDNDELTDEILKTLKDSYLISEASILPRGPAIYRINPNNKDLSTALKMVLF